MGGHRTGDQGDPVAEPGRARRVAEGELIHLDRQPEQRTGLGPARRQGSRVAAGLGRVVEPGQRGGRIREPQPFARLPVYLGRGRAC